MHHRDLAEKALNAALSVSFNVNDYERDERIERATAAEIDLLFAHAAYAKDNSRHLATIEELSNNGRRYSINAE